MVEGVSGDSILWISFALILIVLARQYAPVVKGMLFQPGFYASTGASAVRVG